MTISPLLYMLCNFLKYQNNAGTLAIYNIKELKPYTEIYRVEACKIHCKKQMTTFLDHILGISDCRNFLNTERQKART